MTASADPSGDTIVAIATPPGTGALAIVRLSGPEALAVADGAFRGRRLLSRRGCLRSGWRFRLGRGAGRFQAGDRVADVDGVARLYQDGRYHAGFGRRHLHHRLVGLQLQQRRVLLDAVAGVHQDGGDVAGFDILSQFRECYVSCHRSSARYSG